MVLADSGEIMALPLASLGQTRSIIFELYGGEKQAFIISYFLFRELNLAKCSSSLKRWKKKSEGELSFSKENCPSLVRKMNFHKTNLKGIPSVNINLC